MKHSPRAIAFYKHAVAAGAMVTMPVADMFWGDRCGTVRDRFGYQWTVAPTFAT